MEIAGLRSRIEAIELSNNNNTAYLSGLESRIAKCENNSNNSTPSSTSTEPSFDPDRSIIIFGLPESVSENNDAKVDNLLKNGCKLPTIEPKATKRLVPRTDKPGAVKVEFNTTQGKIKTLCAKMNLKKTPSL